MGQNEQNEQKLLKNGLEDVLKYRFRLQKGVKTPKFFSDFENMYFQLSNALSIVFIRCLDTKIHNMK